MAFGGAAANGRIDAAAPGVAGLATTGAPVPGARLVLATHNLGKLAELRELLSATTPELAPEAVVSAGDLGIEPPVEDGATFAENALIKARALAAATGLPAIADDSGLAVDIMNGSPGIFSAMWSGKHGDDDANLQVLLGQLAEITEPAHRRASFECAAVLVHPDGREWVSHGSMPGELALAPQGTCGFGYDPIFYADHQPPADGRRPAPEFRAAESRGRRRRTNAELTPAEKNAISHRAAALRALLPAVVEVLSG